jgi:hypothetical protein
VIPALLFVGQGATFAAVAGLGARSVQALRRIESSLSAINTSLTMIEARLASLEIEGNGSDPLARPSANVERRATN